MMFSYNEMIIYKNVKYHRYERGIFSPKMRILSLKPHSKYQSNKEQMLFVICLISVLSEAIMLTSTTPPPPPPHTQHLFLMNCYLKKVLLSFTDICAMGNFAVFL